MKNLNLNYNKKITDERIIEMANMPNFNLCDNNNIITDG
jgi:hypothetical protein